MDGIGKVCGGYREGVWMVLGRCADGIGKICGWYREVK